MKKQQTLETYKAKYPASFDPKKLDPSLPLYQLWDGGTMITANLTRQDALKGIFNDVYYIISDQAIGTVNSLLS